MIFIFHSCLPKSTWLNFSDETVHTRSTHRVLSQMDLNRNVTRSVFSKYLVAIVKDDQGQRIFSRANYPKVWTGTWNYFRGAISLPGWPDIKRGGNCILHLRISFTFTSTPGLCGVALATHVIMNCSICPSVWRDAAPLNPSLMQFPGESFVPLSLLCWRLDG